MDYYDQYENFEYFNQMKRSSKKALSKDYFDLYYMRICFTFHKIVYYFMVCLIEKIYGCIKLGMELRNQ